ncbi:RagB/SusD family nutrient uptake outer membrane protein [Chitinophaga lutea]|nr:RagB/SusD family nutrient uptake outer membrane protein [Chitinophaga lutea]
MTTIKHTILRYISCLAASLLLMTACSKVDEQEPFVNIDPAQIFNSPQRIESAAIGMYNALQNAEFLGGRVLIYVDQRGNDVNVSTFFGNVPTFNMISNNAIAQNAWTGGYRTIFETNYFMKKLKENESVIGADAANVYYGEAKFIRALCYYYLVNLYAQTYVFTADASHPGVPLVLDAVTNGAEALSAANKIPRATVKQVYDQMLADLTDASAALPVTWNDDYFNHARATKAAADALMARIYLVMGQWANANAKADAVIGSARGFALTADLRDYFNKDNYATNKEGIFSVATNSSDNPNTNNAIGQHYSPLGRGDISVSAAYRNLANFSATDERRTQLLRTTGTTTLTYWTGKYYTTTFDSWVPVLRLGEIKLIKAEALARLSPAVADPAALATLLEIRTRSNAGALVPPATQAALVDLILTERRIELAFEGHGMIDFLRTKRNIPARPPTQAEIAWNAQLVIFPIPFVDTQQNPQLIQNPGY